MLKSTLIAIAASLVVFTISSYAIQNITNYRGPPYKHDSYSALYSLHVLID
ncbi:MAG: hypothetical protein ACI9E1_001272 [Cryomorphaceae bacterium]|jgi:hypothetical protein